MTERLSLGRHSSRPDDLCPNPVCHRKRPIGKAMCRPCWSRVPRDLQSEVYVTWRRWRADLGNADRMNAWQTAVDAAVGSLA